MTEDPLVRYLRRRTTRRFVARVRARREEVLNTAYRVLGDRDLAEDQQSSRRSISSAAFPTAGWF